MNVVIKTPDLLKQLRELTLNNYSGMNGELDAYENTIRFRKIKARALIASLEKRIVGWATLSKEPSNFSFKNTNTCFNSDMGYLFEVFVDPAHRRKGIGTSLLNRAKLLTFGRSLCVCPHDERSNAFFDKNEKIAMFYR